MTEPTTAAAPTREELEAQLAEIRERELPEVAVEAAPSDELSTRDRSPVKPQDHLAAKGDLVVAEFDGETFEVKRGAVENLRILDKLERGMITTVLRELVGNERFDAFLESNPDADAETAGKLLEALSTAAGSKN